VRCRWGNCRAGLLTTDVTLDLASERATLISQASDPDAPFCFVLGLVRQEIDLLARAYHADIAINNPNDIYVMGGVCADLQGTLCQGPGGWCRVCRTP